MQFTVKAANPVTLATACLVVGIFEDNNLPALTQMLDTASKGAIRKLLRAGDITGKLGQYLLLQKIDGIHAQRVLLVGCGLSHNFDAKKYATTVQHTYKTLQKYNLSEATLTLTNLPVSNILDKRKAELLARLFVINQYRYTTTKSKAPLTTGIERVTVLIADKKGSSATKTGVLIGNAVGKGMNLARELGNLPANICTPTYLGVQAKKLATKNKQLRTQVLTEAQMRKLGMFSLLSVGNGSIEPSVLIVMHYQGTVATERPHVIVGKGITFDTGGISLKPGGGMDEMKFDMCGAASVLGTMSALCELQPEINVIGVIASAENMPGSRATKPGDIVTSMSKQTIEILNTDAEGRLVLCDALTYVERFKPLTVIDIATLTGACITALGSVVSGLLSNDDKLAEQLYSCGINSLDPVWRLPLWDEYQDQLKSNFADIANIGGPKAGTITAGCFLSRFTKKYRWAHLDIAGTAWLQGGEKGATGRPVPLLMEYLLNT
ncbi:MAG: leucyl aminopeptidase [Pseudohongiellaceae bacterium]